jgi:carboxylesterase type B
MNNKLTWSGSYRLGPFGFLTSREMVKEGYEPNNGLLDQKTALLWIKRYVAGFVEIYKM